MNQRTLIVEDGGLELIELLVMVCERSGNNCVVVGTLKEAYQHINEAFDVIYLDHNLEDGNTLELGTQLRANNPAAIMIAASGEEWNRKEQIKIAGCDVQIKQKPLAFQTLAEVYNGQHQRLAA